MKPNKRMSGPWPLFLALIVCAAALCGVSEWKSVSVEVSAPKLIPRGTFFTAECDVTNHTSTRLSRTVRLTIESAAEVGSVALGQREVSVSLSPAETKHVQCNFPNSYRELPAVVDAVVLVPPERSALLPTRPLKTAPADHRAVGIVCGFLSLLVSTLLIVRMWSAHRRDSFVKKAFWTFILLIPLGGWLAYGGLFHPPGYSETPGFSSQWYSN